MVKLMKCQVTFYWTSVVFLSFSPIMLITNEKYYILPVKESLMNIKSVCALSWQVKKILMSSQILFILPKNEEQKWLAEFVSTFSTEINLIPRVFLAFKMAVQRRPWQTEGHMSSTILESLLFQICSGLFDWLI